MKLIADPIILPDNSPWQDIEDAKAKANWHEVISREELEAQTELKGKCGGCRFFLPMEGKYHCRGDCKKGYAGFRQRCTKACKLYEERKGL